MPKAIPKVLEDACNRFADQAGLPSVQQVINRAGAIKPEAGKIIPFKPNLYWIEKE